MTLSRRAWRDVLLSGLVLQSAVGTLATQRNASSVSGVVTRTGDPVAIEGYIGKGPSFTAAMIRFVRSYADQNERDHAQLLRAIADGTVESTGEGFS